MEALVKGNQIKIAKEFILQKFGADAVDRVLRHLDEKSKQVVSKRNLDAGREPEEAFMAYVAAVEKAFGKGDYQLCREMGIYLAKESMPKFYRIFMKLGDPLFIIKRASQVWSQIHNTGRLEVAAVSEKSASARLIDFKFSNKAFCAMLQGFFQGTLELCGSGNIFMREVNCITEGAEFCEFIGSWE